MPDGPLPDLIRRLRRLVRAREEDGLADAGLLRPWLRERDPAAFEVLLWRHGPLVLRVCRRVTRREQDAEDAFQATFLALARRARSIRRPEAVAGWLSQVARPDDDRRSTRAGGAGEVETPPAPPARVTKVGPFPATA